MPWHLSMGNFLEDENVHCIIQNRILHHFHSEACLGFQNELMWWIFHFLNSKPDNSPGKTQYVISFHLHNQYCITHWNLHSPCEGDIRFSLLICMLCVVKYFGEEVGRVYIFGFSLFFTIGFLMILAYFFYWYWPCRMIKCYVIKGHLNSPDEFL